MALQKVLSYTKGLEDPEHPLMGPTIKGLYLFGLWQTGTKFRTISYNCVHCSTVIFVISQIMDLYGVRHDLNLVLNNMSLTVLSVICVTKRFSFVSHQKKWRELVNQISKTELNQIEEQDKITMKLIKQYTKYTRVVTYLFWVLVFFTNLLLILSPFFKFMSKAYRADVISGKEPLPQILFSWFPFENKKMPGYFAGILVHVIMGCQGSGVIAVFDMNAVAVMSYLKGQTIILREKCSRIFEAESSRDVMSNIRKCHQLHNVLVKEKLQHRKNYGCFNTPLDWCPNCFYTVGTPMKSQSSLEDQDNPLLGPNLWALQKWRIWQPNYSGFSCNTIHVLGVLLVISQYVELWFIRSDLEQALRNLSVTMLSSICMVKAISFICWQKQWKEVIDYVSNLEKQQLEKNDEAARAVIKEYTKYSRMVTYLYWCLVTVTLVIFILTPLFGFVSSTEYRYLIRNGSAPYPELLSFWLPFDRTRGFGYWFSFVEHSWICSYCGGILAHYDSNAVAIMTFFAGQLKLLSINCSRLFDGDEVISYPKAVKRIRECHFHHVYLVKFSSIFNSLLSPVMFLYVITCSLVICACAMQMTTGNTKNMQRIWIAQFLMALIAQLFLFCWHSNEVLYTVRNLLYLPPKMIIHEL
ncbi:Odorant receptor [Operophtera brumata]|uniref:Odorant receptor n=1 Tax=Operophtera brumata TaxID=104452 RepID=A0A0L7L9K8_OPEBR|nr:Odorant receptor [Operophtera brumata]